MFNAYTTFTPSSACSGNSPSVSTGTWDIDRDNANFYFSFGSGNGSWSTITTLNSTTMVLTNIQYQQYAGYRNGNNVYHDITETRTLTAQ
jgi:hypothetical protein